eukprot:jgi/Antlo1/2538/1049
MPSSSGDMLACEARRCGLKTITRMIYEVIKREKRCTYNAICSQLRLLSEKTTRRRIYDVLNIMRSLNMVSKCRRMYFLVTKESLDLQSIYRKKLDEIEKIREIRDVFGRLVDRNELTKTYDADILHLPFVIIATDKSAEVHIETNEDRTFFSFRCTRELRIIEDIEIIKALFKSYGHKKENIQPIMCTRPSPRTKSEQENELYNCLF